jgi:DNA-binding Xre family transcriptional regulator
MTQTSTLLNSLKKYLRIKNVTYQDLAQQLSLSEASIKRLFSEQSFSLKRLEETCNYLDISIYDLIRVSEKEANQPKLLTFKQEEFLANNPKVLIFFYLLKNEWSIQDIEKKFSLSPLDMTKNMIQLEKLGLLALYPENQFKWNIAKNFFWRKDGPVWNTYKTQVKQEFLNDDFNSNAVLKFSLAELSIESQLTLTKKLKQLSKEFHDLAEIDSAITREERDSCGLLIAFRPWVFSIISALEKNNND